MLAVSSFFGKGSGQQAGWLTKRAPDAGDSAASQAFISAVEFFLLPSGLSPCPSAGNANRSAAVCKNKALF